MTSQASMWKLGEVRSNAKGGKFLCLEPLFWQSEASLEIPWEPRAFSEGQRPSVSFATDERARLFWERAETDLVEQLAAASERVFELQINDSEGFLAFVETLKTDRSKACMSVPTQVGARTLQLSKLMMEKAYYLHMRRLFPKMRLLFTDTDSVTRSTPWPRRT